MKQTPNESSKNARERLQCMNSSRLGDQIADPEEKEVHDKSQWRCATPIDADWRNIMELYIANDCKVPFLVRRDSWHQGQAICVVKVKPEQTPNGVYGCAIGYELPNKFGGDLGGYYGVKGHPVPIPCAGCYEWQRVDAKRHSHD